MWAPVPPGGYVGDPSTWGVKMCKILHELVPVLHEELLHYFVRLAFFARELKLPRVGHIK